MANDFAGGLIYHAVEKLATRSQENAEALYTVFLARPESPVVGMVVNALLGLAKFNPKKAHQKTLALTESEQTTLRRIGIATLGGFKYSGSEWQELLDSTLERLEALRISPNKETDYVLVQTYGSLIDQAANQAEIVTEALVELAARYDPATQNYIASVLATKAEIAYDQSWYKESLLKSARIPSPSEGKLRYLDSCAKRYVKNDPTLALKVIEAVVVNWNFNRGREYAELPELLQGTFVEMYNNQRHVLMAAITRWFASNDRHLHLIACDVFNYFNSSVINKEKVKSPILTLSRDVLNNLDEQTVIYVIHRIAGYITDATALTALLLSVLGREPYSLHIVNWITEFLTEYVLYNYPHTTGEYLKSWTKVGDTTEIELSVIQTTLERSKTYFEARQNLPRLKELQPPSQRVYLLQLAKWKQQAAMMEAAEQRSVLRSLVSNIPLKYGRAFFVEREGTFTEPSQLGTISHELELPLGEFIDSLGQTFDRMEWQSVGLNKVEDEPNGEADT